MLYLKRLKNLFAYKTLLNNYFLGAIFLFLGVFSLIHYWLVIFLILYGFYLFKKSKLILFFSLCILFLSLITYVINVNYKIKEAKTYYGQIVSVEKKDDYQIIIIKAKIKKIMIYEDIQNTYSVLDYIEVKGKTKEIENRRIPKGFDYKQYLISKKIGLVLNANEINVIKKKPNIRYFREVILKYVDKKFPSNAKAFIKGLVIGENNEFDENFKESLKVNGIMHLFAISGTHIAILVLMLEKILRNFKKRHLMISIFLGIYLVITAFSPSVLRAVLMYYLVLINKKYNLFLSTLDIVSIIFICLLIVDPFYLEDLGFALSFLMAFTIVLIAPLIDGKRKVFQIFWISLAALIVTLPIVININHEINLLMPLINIVFIFLVSELMLPFSFIVFIFFPLRGIFDYLCLGFMELSQFISKYFSLNIKIPYFSIYHSLIYFSLITIFLTIFKTVKKRNLFLISVISLLTCFTLFNSVRPFLKVVFLDLSLGEATVITYGFSTIIIDTGDGRNNEVTNYLLREGIYTVDYLILTHDHIDHNGEAFYLINKLRVKNTVMSIYDKNNYSKTNNIHVEKLMHINLYKMEVLIIPPFKKYINENDNSLITYIKSDINMLFLGDIEKEGEARLNSYNFNVDAVKIAHHGSKTSTSLAFLKMVNFKYAIIQTGRVKKFGFPNTEVINNLLAFNKQIYRTDIDYTITFKRGKFYCFNN